MTTPAVTDTVAPPADRALGARVYAGPHHLRLLPAVLEETERLVAANGSLVSWRQIDRHDQENYYFLLCKSQTKLVGWAVNESLVYELKPNSFVSRKQNLRLAGREIQMLSEF